MNRILLRKIVGFIILTALFLQLSYLPETSDPSVINFFSLFTIWSNVFVVLIYFFSLSDFWRGASVVYMTITMLGFAILFQGKNEYLLPSVNLIFHYLVPILVMLDWITSISTERITFKKTQRWLIFPLLYFLYVMVRGSLTNSYPYPLLNPLEVGGLMNVIGFVAVMVLGLEAIGLIIINLPSRSRSTPQL